MGTAFGLRAVVSAFIQSWLAHRPYLAKRDFEEKKESYLGFLDALHRSEIDGTSEAALFVGHWQSWSDRAWS